MLVTAYPDESGEVRLEFCIGGMNRMLHPSLVPRLFYARSVAWERENGLVSVFSDKITYMSWETNSMEAQKEIN